MKLKEIQKIFHKQLSPFFAATEIDTFFFLLMEAYLNLKPFQLALQPQTQLSKKEESLFLKALDQLKQQKPIQQILRKTDFYGLSFNINKHVLIPRPETEELVKWIINDVCHSDKLCHSDRSEESPNKKATQKKPLKILDIGTGSGCIAISLAKNIPYGEVYAVDISEKALQLAKENAEKNQVNIQCIQADILNLPHFDNILKKLKFDVIISNPPYITHAEKKQMKTNVLDYEPHLALFVPNNDPLLFYKKITQLATDFLNPNGSLYFEINPNFLQEIQQLLHNKKFVQIQLKKDIFEKNRMIKSIKNNE